MIQIYTNLDDQFTENNKGIKNKILMSCCVFTKVRTLFKLSQRRSDNSDPVQVNFVFAYCVMISTNVIRQHVSNEVLCFEFFCCDSLLKPKGS